MSHTFENDSIGYTLRTNHVREHWLEVRKTGLVYIYGQPLQDRPVVEPVFGRYKKREDNTWRYEGELFIGRDPRNAKLLKAALLALSRAGI